MKVRVEFCHAPRYLSCRISGPTSATLRVLLQVAGIVCGASDCAWRRDGAFRVGLTDNVAVQFQDDLRFEVLRRLFSQ
jgi:hypothetical protein